MQEQSLQDQICIIGLGYVGLPLAVEFGKKYQAVGFDIKQTRVDELNGGVDSTLEVESELLTSVLKKNQKKTTSLSKRNLSRCILLQSPIASYRIKRSTS